VTGEASDDLRKELAGSHWRKNVVVHNDSLLADHKIRQVLSGTTEKCLPGDVFFVYQSASQASLMRTYGMDTLYIDSTHGVDVHSNKMFTVLVAGPFLKGRVVGCCVFSKENALTIETALRVLRHNAKTDTVSLKGVHCVMTDKDLKEVAAIEEVFAPKEHRFCSWHMKKVVEARPWRSSYPVQALSKNISAKVSFKTKSKPQQNDIYKTIVGIMEHGKCCISP